MWLRDFLPEQVKGARILVYGYNSALIGPRTSVSSVKDFACDLLQRIVDDRSNVEVNGPCNYVEKSNNLLLGAKPALDLH